MAYITTCEQRPEYIHARIEGPESYEEAVRFWRELAGLASDSGHRKFLVKDKVKGVLTTSEHYYISLEVAGLFHGKQIAYVDAKEDTFSRNSFGATVVNNRGVRAEVFRSEEVALQWLLACRD
jgi:hypothetical protein